jgi:hypothetical protein
MIKQFKRNDIKYKLTDIKQRDSWWQMVFTAALQIARQKLQDYFERNSEILFKNYCLYIQRFLVEPLKIFCGTLAVRHRYMCIDI